MARSLPTSNLVASVCRILRCPLPRSIDQRTGELGDFLSNALDPHRGEMRAFLDSGSPRLSRSLAKLWTSLFPMVQPPVSADGLGIIVLNSNAETHFSFTNALGIVS